MKLRFFAVALASAVFPFIGGAQSKVGHDPIIDMHIHAELLAEFGGPGLALCTGDASPIFAGLDPKAGISIEKTLKCEHKIRSTTTDATLLQETLAMFKRYNVRRAVVFGDLEYMTSWRAAAPDIFIPALNFVDRETSPAAYRRMFAENKFEVFAEITAQYRGLRPDDAALEPYFALAEELDIPVGIHLGEGPPGGAHTVGSATFRAALGNPYLLEEVLVRHPKLRVYAMHYGSPLVDQMISMLYHHPQLYVDISANDWMMPRKQFYEHLRKMIDAGMEERIMFGSDQMIWPTAIEKSIQTIEAAPFLTVKQKRDIFYNNAARFLRLSKDAIARDHRR